VRKAAVTLHLTAAAVNQQILNLEAQVGVPLFDRLPRGMQLTTAGELVLAAVRRSQRDFDNALAQVEDLRALRRGHVRVGVSHATAEYLLPLVIASLHGRYPGITFSVRSGTGEELLRGVAQGEIDVAYCLRRPRPLVETSSVPMVRRLVAGSTALGFLVPDNVAEDVAAGRLLWRPLHDAGAQLPGCLYQRIGYTRAAAMRLFLDELERVADAMRAGFETGVSWSLKDLAT
jgi:DNA-binding transcriptional LysR family regulator